MKSLDKYQGAGNSFLLGWRKDFETQDLAALAEDLCDPHFGIGADGLVLLTANGNRIRWDFFNSDGSAAEFCGNAARCAALFVHEHMNIKNFELESLAGISAVRWLTPEEVEIEMVPVKYLDRKFKTPFWSEPLLWVNTGVPHLVIKVEKESDLLNFEKEAQQLRFWKGLGPAGSNVTFVFVVSPHQAKAVSFERGVEGFTLACGTGAIAAAAYLKENFSNQESRIQMPGGEIRIFLSDDKVIMRGPAQKIANVLIEDKK